MGIDPKTWGSKRWVLYNRRLDKTTLRLWEQYTIDAYRWQIDLGILESVECTATAEMGNRLNYTVLRKYPSGELNRTQYSVLWEGGR